jgi:hypothetical protein
MLLIEAALLRMRHAKHSHTRHHQERNFTYHAFYLNFINTVYRLVVKLKLSGVKDEGAG